MTQEREFSFNNNIFRWISPDFMPKTTVKYGEGEV
jgi:hypothetical protein